jgi:hypothetical protein
LSLSLNESRASRLKYFMAKPHGRLVTVSFTHC